MTPVETDGELIEPAWDCFGIRRMDFRPHWDGDYVNIFTTVEPQELEETTATLMRKFERSLFGMDTGESNEIWHADRFLVIYRLANGCL